MKKSLFVTLCIFASFCFSCVPADTGIPDYPVYVKRNIDTEKLVNFGSYLYLKDRQLEKDRIGYGGILVVKAFDGFYYAFDLCCTNEKDPKILISPPTESLTCTCETCGEVYDMSFGLGVPTKKLSKVPLKRYSTYIDEYNYLIVSP